MIFPFGETVTLVSRTITRDAYGHETITEVRTDLPGCAVAPRVSEEGTQRGRAAVIVGLTVYLPTGTILDADDQLEIGGLLYDVDGEAGVWRSPFTGWAPGVEVALKRATG